MFLILSSRSDSERQSIMPLHKYAPKMWDALKLKQGIYTRLPQHYLKSLEQKEPTPVHWKPLGVEYQRNPKTGHKERVQDVPIPIYYPPQSQDGLWGGEGWISGFRYANNDKASLHNNDFLSLVMFCCFYCLGNQSCILKFVCICIRVYTVQLKWTKLYFWQGFQDTTTRYKYDIRMLIQYCQAIQPWTPLCYLEVVDFSQMSEFKINHKSIFWHHTSVHPSSVVIEFWMISFGSCRLVWGRPGNRRCSKESYTVKSSTTSSPSR